MRIQSSDYVLRVGETAREPSLPDNKRTHIFTHIRTSALYIITEIIIIQTFIQRAFSTLEAASKSWSEQYFYRPLTQRTITPLVA